MRFTRWLLEQQMSYQEALEVLGISADNASDKDFLKKQWKKLALQHHPDRGGSEKMMQRINAAYDILAKGEKGGSKTGSGSKSGGARKGGRSREERQREEEKWKEKRKEIKAKGREVWMDG